MLIECPSCHARAKLPDSKEGAKVRCGECGRVYVAVPAGERGARARRTSSSSGLYIGLGVGAAALLAVLFFYAQSGKKSEPKAAVVEEEEEPLGDSTGWDSPPVKLARQIHNAAHAYDQDKLMTLLHGARIYERIQGAREDLGDGEDPAEPADTSARDEFTLMPAHERQEFLAAQVEDLVQGESKALVADWEPYDGSVILETDDEATVRLAVSPRNPDEGVTKRWVEWKLALDSGRWKAWSWERWISPEERKAERKRRGRGFEQVTLSDGSKVLEREPEPLPHLEDTSPELAKRIDELFATMIDLDLTSEASRARRELEEIGRPAIPILLTGLYETPLDTEEQSIQVNIMVQALRTITGQYFGYKPMELVGSGVGTTKERRESAIKQWFAWWYRNKKKFTEKEVVDGLEGKVELTEREKRFLDREN